MHIDGEKKQSADTDGRVRNLLSAPNFIVSMDCSDFAFSLIFINTPTTLSPRLCQRYIVFKGGTSRDAMEEVGENYLAKFCRCESTSRLTLGFTGAGVYLPVCLAEKGLLCLVLAIVSGREGCIYRAPFRAFMHLCR